MRNAFYILGVIADLAILFLSLSCIFLGIGTTEDYGYVFFAAVGCILDLIRRIANKHTS